MVSGVALPKYILPLAEEKNIFRRRIIDMKTPYGTCVPELQEDLMEEKNNDFYVYGAWASREDLGDASKTLYIGKGSGDRIDAKHDNVPDYDKLHHAKFKNLENLTEDEALTEEKRLIEKNKPKYNDYLK